jgi:hypothetical protein
MPSSYTSVGLNIKLYPPHYTMAFSKDSWIGSQHDARAGTAFLAVCCLQMHHPGLATQHTSATNRQSTCIMTISPATRCTTPEAQTASVTLTKLGCWPSATEVKILQQLLARRTYTVVRSMPTSCFPACINRHGKKSISCRTEHWMSWKAAVAALETSSLQLEIQSMTACRLCHNTGK